MCSRSSAEVKVLNDEEVRSSSYHTTDSLTALTRAPNLRMLNKTDTNWNADLDPFKELRFASNLNQDRHKTARHFVMAFCVLWAHKTNVQERKGSLRSRYVSHLRSFPFSFFTR